MLRRGGEQRVCLQPHENPEIDVVQSFKASHGLSQALSMERKSQANGQLAYLKKKEQALTYVMDARQRPPPPLASVGAHQGLISDLRRAAVNHAGLGAVERGPSKERRLEKQEAFLASRKQRHDEALEAFERSVDSVSEQRQASTERVSAKAQEELLEVDQVVEQLLHPLEVATENLGAWAEADIDNVMTSLEEVTQRRQRLVADLTARLGAVDQNYREECSELMAGLAEQLTTAAHVMPGETERLVEQKALQLNTVHLENQKAVSVLQSKLLVQTLEKAKENKARWHKGQLLWKQKRHRHALETIRGRIESDEFCQPESLKHILGRLREQQRGSFEARTALITEMFQTPVPDLVPSSVRVFEERNNSHNEQVQASLDGFVAELKHFKDELDATAEEMMQQLCRELELHDARAEWGNYQSVTELVDGELRPSLTACLEQVATLVLTTMDMASKQDEAQHSISSRSVAYFKELGSQQEQLQKGVEDFELKYEGEVENCSTGDEQRCKKNEQLLDEQQAEMRAAAHHEALNELKEQTFQHLDDMAQGYRDHADQLLSIHTNYPDNVAAFIEAETQAFCSRLDQAAEAVLKPEANAKGGEDAAPAAVEAPIEEPVVEKETKKKGKAKKDAKAAPAPVEAPPEPVKAPVEEKIEPPTLPDGTVVFDVLMFELPWLEELLARERTDVLAHIESCRTNLDRVDISTRCEEVRRELDQRLRKHTNRKGEVQVEWYMPRYNIISKHKDNFERHLIDVAKRNQGHDAAVTALYSELEATGEAYRDALAQLQQRFGEAEALSTLSAVEREAHDMAGTFTEFCQQAREKLSNFATKAPRGLQKENQSFLRTCTHGDDSYSTTEIAFYNHELEELNNALDQRCQERSERLQQLAVELEEKRDKPLAEFMESYAKVVESLCASKGLGRKHGEQRRKAQERCRTLIAQVATVRQNILDVSGYFRNICTSPGIELPQCPCFQLKTFFTQEPQEPTGDTWTFSAELIGVLYMCVCSVNFLGTHLQAFQAEKASRYKADSIPAIRVLSEVEAVCSAEDQAGKAAEQALREECLGRMLGSLTKTDSFAGEIQSIEKASQDAYSGKQGGLPPFMQSFLSEMNASANRARQETSFFLRETSNALRDEILPTLGDALFGELCMRSVAELEQSSRGAHAASAETWAELDKRRSTHERQLNPGLANPNAEQQLRELMRAEVDRHKSAVALVTEDRTRMAECLRSQCDTLVARMAACFEASVRLVDAVPLHGHFAGLPGDEQDEAARKSIKRCARQMQAPAAGSDQSPSDGLPSRIWPGLPRFELRRQLRGGEWPLDTALEEAEAKAAQPPEPPAPPPKAEKKGGAKAAKGAPPPVQQPPEPPQDPEQTKAIQSFRSAVHKSLFERRDYYFSQYRERFLAEVRRRNNELVARDEKEQVDQQRWESMVKQLNPDLAACLKAEEDKQEPAAPPPAEEAPPDKKQSGGKPVSKPGSSNAKKKPGGKK